jgi:hypothetical protein
MHRLMGCKLLACQQQLQAKLVLLLLVLCLSASLPVLQGSSEVFKYGEEPEQAGKDIGTHWTYGEQQQMCAHPPTCRMQLPACSTVFPACARQNLPRSVSSTSPPSEYVSGMSSSASSSNSVCKHVATCSSGDHVQPKQHILAPRASSFLSHELSSPSTAQSCCLQDWLVRTG